MGSMDMGFDRTCGNGDKARIWSMNNVMTLESVVDYLQHFFYWLFYFFVYNKKYLWPTYPMRSGIYKEHSTGDNFSDSVAYGTEELGNPWIIHFYKQYREHISLEMLRMYHHLHHYFSMISIPDLSVSINYEWTQYNRISFSVLDLDPTAIYTASDRETGKQHWITQPKYIDTMDSEEHLFLQSIILSSQQELRSSIWSHLWNFFHRNGIYLRTRIDVTNNIKFVDIQWDCIYAVITDMWSYIQEFCIDNIERANNTIPNWHTTKIQTRKELNKTLLWYVDYTPIL